MLGRDRDEVVVLLTSLHDQILASDQVIGGDHTILVSDLLLVEANAVRSDQLAQLALGLKDRCMLYQ